ncbi:MAG TPA: exonuclease domain-containing protein, partial [Chloroflexota bacterium]|nr:exonuclease domain-containing protein [Chloroflexota bacterium]
EHDQIVKSFTTLLNPRLPVPPRIQRLTGISDAMLRHSPPLEDVLPSVIRLIDGAVLVAHNLAFGFGFLRRAAATTGVDISPPRLCTLRLARRLLPELESHRLDYLIGELSLSCSFGQRAEVHALQAGELYRWLLERADDDTLRACLKLDARVDRAPREPELWQGLPSSAGVYILKDAAGRVLYVGKSMNLRRRVREHLRQRWHPQRRLRRELRRVRHIDVIETDTDLEALFLEARLIKRYQPNGNSAERLERFAAYVAVDRGAPFPSIRVIDYPQSDGQAVYGPFGSRSMLEAGVRALADAVGLCAYGDPARCRPNVPRHCLGPCGLNSDSSQYRDAVDSALCLLRGDDQRLLDCLRQRRDHEADGLNFEAAAALRDRIFALERLVGDERWRQDIRAVNVVLILPAEQPEFRKLVCIRENRLAGAQRVATKVEPGEVLDFLESMFKAADPPLVSSNEVTEEMRLVHQWLRRARYSHPVVPVDVECLSVTAGTIASVLSDPKSANCVP